MKYEAIKKNKQILKSISISLLLKPVSMLISLLFTPIFLNFMGQEQYGVWQTLMSIMNWITVFDFGINGGLTLLLTAAIVEKNEEEIKKVIATAYGLVSIIFCISYLIIIVLCIVCNWQTLLNTTVPVKFSVLIVATYICLSFVFSLTNSIFSANQKAEGVTILQTVIQFMNLLNVYFIAKLCSNYSNKLFIASCIYFFDGVIVNVIVLMIIWYKKRIFKPKLSFFDKNKIKELTSVGLKIFFIQIAGLILFMTDNLIISNLYTPNEVTPYSITYNMFNLFYIIFIAILQPMWSKYTMEKEKNNFKWIKKSIFLQLGIYILFLFGIFFAIFIFKPFSIFWLKRDLNIPINLILIIGIYNAILIFTCIFQTVINGTGNLNYCLVTSLIGAIINIPLSFFFAKNLNLGLTGIALGTVVSLLPAAIVLPIETFKYLNKKIKISV